MEQFNDTPIVNGTAYPTTTVDPKSYRFRILNAANDRVWNLSWYVADSTGTEVALNPAELAAAQTDPNIVPTPDTTISPPGPSWIQIGTEGGFLPAPTVVPPQPTTWIIDPTRFDVGNVDKHSLVLAPAERGDVIVDFTQVRGQDAHPVQRRARRLSGPGRDVRLLHRHARPRVPDRSCPATARTRGPSCRSRSTPAAQPRRST